ncbi:MAG: hypothetical protein SWX82_27095 [Cyanobacteriota bacterium]|nr:hypothetical protein [Cyanobacteriota bacterium]
MGSVGRLGGVGSVGSVGSVGRVGRIIVRVIFLFRNTFRPDAI